MGPRTRAVLVANPGNPTGTVFTSTEMNTIAGLCARWNATLVVDEIYADLVYSGAFAPSWPLRRSYAFCAAWSNFTSV